MLKGHCECGQVSFEVNGVIHDLSHCHCSQCRRLHGAAFATFAGVKRNEFRFTAGQDHVSHYASSYRNDRQFCEYCGSNILVDSSEEPEWLYLSMSTIEGAPVTPRAHHDWVGSKAPWWEITDDLPRNEAEEPED